MTQNKRIAQVVIKPQDQSLAPWFETTSNGTLHDEINEARKNAGLADQELLSFSQDLTKVDESVAGFLDREVREANFAQQMSKISLACADSINCKLFLLATALQRQA